MSVLVVYESMFGSTRAVAEAVAEGLRSASGTDVRVEEVSAWDKELPADLALLVVGGPTHALSMSRPETRADAVRESTDGTVVSSSGVREWLEGATLPAGLAVAAFGTKVARPPIPGSAAKSIDKALRGLGARPVTKPRWFGVHGKADGLAEGALDEARAWGSSLGTALQPA